MTRPNPSTFLQAPDEAFRLSPSERQDLPLVVDADALEEFLAWLRPEHRGDVLKVYQQMRDKKVAFGQPFGTTGNPDVDAILRRVVNPQQGLRERDP